MSSDEARYVIAHEVGIDLRRHSVPEPVVERVRRLRRDGATTRFSEEAAASAPRVTSIIPPEVVTRRATPSSPATRFDSRNLHAAIVASSRRAFVRNLRQDAVLRAFKSVNNRVKKITSIRDDGQSLMGKVFGGAEPKLQMTPLGSESEQNEQVGLQFLMMGAMTGMRNPRAHEDHWPPDDDEEAVLESLGLASLLHRMLDRCEASIQ
jgi:uncharacterized protein (TIGR02391 family)